MSHRPRIWPSDERHTQRAAERLRRGGLVAIPTETVYGLAARARDDAAVAAVFRAKGRPLDHPLIVHLHDLEALPQWAARPSPEALAAARAFWPGPLTLVLPRADGVGDTVTGGHATVALRMPAHPVARALLQALGDAVAAPSANRFGRVSPTRPGHVASEFRDLDLVILDGGPSEVGIESTILDLSSAEPRVLRPGHIAASAIAAAIGRPVGDTAGSSDAPAAPGRLASHYAPATPLRWLPQPQGVAPPLDPDAALLLVHAAVPHGHRGTVIRLPQDPEGYARRLYHALRELDAARSPQLAVEAPPDLPAWAAVRDRLARAVVDRREPDRSASDRPGERRHDPLVPGDPP